MEHKLVDGMVRRIGQHIYIVDAHSNESLEDAIIRGVYKVARLYQSEITFNSKLSIGKTLIYKSTADGKTKICTRRIEVLGQVLPMKKTGRFVYGARTKIHVDPDCSM